MMRLPAAFSVLIFSSLTCNFLAGRPTPPPEIDAALGRFAGRDADLEAAFADLDGAILEDPGGVEAAALARLGASDPQVRFAAVFALANTATTSPGERALVELLESEDITERAVAAEALIHRGVKAAIPVLVEHLDEETSLRFAEPPQPAWSHAQFLLTLYVEQDFGLLQAADERAAAEAQPAWQAWWDANAESLVWDEVALVFRDETP